MQSSLPRSGFLYSLSRLEGINSWAVVLTSERMFSGTVTLTRSAAKPHVGPIFSWPRPRATHSSPSRATGGVFAGRSEPAGA
jgi:hypothetical protein